MGRGSYCRFALLALLLAGIALPAPASAAPKAIGYIAYWDQARAVRSLQANPGTFAEISPSWFAPGPRGGVVKQEASVNTDPALVDLAHRLGVKVMPAIANYRDRVWSSTTVSRVLNDPVKRKRHVEALVNLVMYRNYDGIDVDYEHLRATDRNALSTFVAELSSAMHAKGKRVSVAVHPKQSEPGNQPKNQAQDYAALGRAADEVRVMVYDYAWETSPPGPGAPISWVDAVINWTVTQIPRDKVVLGAPLYGYDWPATGAGESFMWNELAALPGALLANWDAASATPWFRYSAGGTAHTVWFENARSAAAKLDVARRYGIGGVHFWRLGGEDPATWPVVRAWSLG
jgi:spore germination protein